MRASSLYFVRIVVKESILWVITLNQADLPRPLHVAMSTMSGNRAFNSGWTNQKSNLALPRPRPH